MFAHSHVATPTELSFHSKTYTSTILLSPNHAHILKETRSEQEVASMQGEEGKHRVEIHALLEE